MRVAGQPALPLRFRYHEVDNRTMLRFKILCLFFHITFPALLLADPLQKVYHRTAKEAPDAQVQFFTGGAEAADEIDQQIENYFAQIKSSSQVDIDQKKLDQLFRSKHSTENEYFSSEEVSDENIEEENNQEGGLVRMSNSNATLVNHRVKPKDTVWGIGKRYGVSPKAILKHNPHLKNRPLYIGEEILIYRGKTTAPKPIQKVVYYRVRKGDTLGHIARRYGTTVNRLARWNGIRKKSIIRIGQRLKVKKAPKKAPPGYTYRSVFSWPLRGRITSRFGRRRNPFTRSRRQFHKGLDIGVALGTPIRAARDGVVIFSGRLGGYGNCVFIRHTNGYVSVYAHNKINHVKRGEVVQKGAKIAEVGRTGSATGPHLHFEVRRGTKPINPISAFRLTELVAVNKKSTKSVSKRGG